MKYTYLLNEMGMVHLPSFKQHEKWWEEEGEAANSRPTGEESWYLQQPIQEIISILRHYKGYLKHYWT